MLFNSIDFLIFFPIVVGVLFVIPKKLRCLWLLVVSYYFYPKIPIRLYTGLSY